MCAYKVVSIEFKYFGIQGTVESMGHKVYCSLTGYGNC